MKKDISISIPRGTKQEKKLLKFLQKKSVQVVDCNKELEAAIQRYVGYSKRPLLAIILGSSIMNHEHLDQVNKVFDGQKFNELDILLQVVAGDLEVGNKIAEMIRSKVTGKLSCIIPITVAGPGTLIAMHADEIIGKDITNICPIDGASIHPCIIEWKESTGQVHPAYFENKSEYEKLYSEANTFKDALLAMGYPQALINHLSVQREISDGDFNIPQLAGLGLKARLASKKELKHIEIVFDWVLKSFDDLIALFN
jgi:hypothetical protein